MVVSTSCSPVQYTFEDGNGGVDECGGVGVWFRVQIPNSGFAIFKTLPPGTNTDTRLKVYSGTCGNLTLLSEDCQDDDNTDIDNHEQIVLTGAPGEIRYIVVDDFGSGGTFSVCVFFPEDCDANSRLKYSFNFDNSLVDICRGQTFSIIGSEGSYTSEPLLNNETVYCFDENDGFEISTTDLDIGCEYSVELYFKFDSYADYARILDFTDAFTDYGLYAYEDDLMFYDYTSLDLNVFSSTDRYYHVVFTYDRGVIKMYVDGVLLQTLTDENNAALPSAYSNNIRIFKDDGTEDEPGCVRMINIYNFALDEQTISTQSLDPTSESCIIQAIPTLSEWGVIILGLMLSICAWVSLKHRISTSTM